MTAQELYDRGVQLHGQGRFEEAEAAYRQALALAPTLATAHNNLGVLLRRAGRPAEAEAAYRAALQHEPGYASAWSNLGNLLGSTGRAHEGVQAQRKAVACDPNHGNAWNNLGNLLQGLQGHAEAEAAYRKAIELRPTDAHPRSNLGRLLAALDRCEEAESCCRRAVELAPGQPEVHNTLGAVLQQGRRWRDAEACYRRAVEVDATHAGAWSNLGVVLREQGRLEESETAFLRSLALDPRAAQAHSNYGVLLRYLGRWDDAETEYRRAIELDPADPSPRLNLSFLLLARGDYAAAWPLHEARWHPRRKQSDTVPPKSVAYPCWRGEPLRGRSIAIWPEQGIGDAIQFVRFAAALKDRGASQVTLATRPALGELMETAAGVDRVVTRPSDLGPHDFWCFSMSLPLHLGTTLQSLPGRLPYLAVPPRRRARWAGRLPGGRKVGLVWKGSQRHPNDAHRSLPGLAALAPLWSVPGITFVSLQKGAGEDEARQPPASQPLLALGHELDDLADAAAVLEQLDLVICVDTAIAHLAGALGKPVWVLLPEWATDWRWLRGRADSPWYPGVMRLFRQPVRGDWDSVVREVTQALRGTAPVRPATAPPG